MDRMTQVEHKKIAAALWGLVKVENSNIFDFITKEISDYLQADFVFISMLPEKNDDYVEPVSFFAEGKLAETYSYQIANTPCAIVVNTSKIMSYCQIWCMALGGLPVRFFLYLYSIFKFGVVNHQRQ